MQICLNIIVFSAKHPDTSVSEPNAEVLHQNVGFTKFWHYFLFPLVTSVHIISTVCFSMATHGLKVEPIVDSKEIFRK